MTWLKVGVHPEAVDWEVLDLLRGVILSDCIEANDETGECVVHKNVIERGRRIRTFEVVKRNIILYKPAR